MLHHGGKFLTMFCEDCNDTSNADDDISGATAFTGGDNNHQSTYFFCEQR